MAEFDACRSVTSTATIVFTLLIVVIYILLILAVFGVQTGWLTLSGTIVFVIALIYAFFRVRTPLQLR